MILVLKRFFNFYPKKTLLLTFLLFLENVLEGLGISLVIPIFYKLLNQNDTSNSMVNWIDSLYLSFNIKPTISDILLGLIMAFAFKGGIMYASRIMVAKTSGHFLIDMQRKLFSQLLSARYSFFFDIKQGSLVNALTSEVTRAALTFIYTAQWLSSIFSLLLYVTWAVVISGKLTFLACLLACLAVAPLRRITKYCEEYGQKTTQLNEDIQSDLIETFSSIKIIKASANEELILKRFEKKIFDYGVNWYKTYFYSGGMAIFSQPIAVVVLSAILYFGHRLQVPVPELLVFLLAFQKLIPTFTTMQSIKNNLMVVLPGFDRVESLLQDIRKAQERVGGIHVDQIKHEINLENVSFSYSNNNELFNALNFTIPSGKTVAILGGSGQGKTTLVDLILGIYPIQDGEIFVDKNDLSMLDLKSWRKNISYVSQDTFLFHDTVKNNITWGNSEIPMDEIILACKNAAAYDFIMGLDHGFDTLVGDRGIKMSGGQKQRIALARALVKRPKLLILDEATSSLDYESEFLIKDSIHHLKEKDKDLTIIMIAHRLATVQNADYIFVLGNGNIIEQGTWQELMSMKNSYVYKNINFQHQV